MNYLKTAYIFTSHLPATHFNIIPHALLKRRPGELSRYSDSLRARLSGDRIPVGLEIFRKPPDRSWGPPSLLYNGYSVFLRGESGRGMVLIPHPYLQCRDLKLGRAIPLPTLRVLVVYKGATFTFIPETFKMSLLLSFPSILFPSQCPRIVNRIDLNEIYQNYEALHFSIFTALQFLPLP